MSNPSNFHIKEGQKFEPKELFKRIAAIAREHHGDTSRLSILDIGCAAGELPYFLKQSLASKGLVAGVDIGEELIANAQARFGNEGCEFAVGNAADFQLGKKFDVVTATSVMSYFTEAEPFLKNFVKHLTDTGIGIISGIFNDHGFSVRLSYQKEGSAEWHQGFNQFPISLVKNCLAELGYNCEVEEQVMPFDLAKPENKLRSWSVNVDGVRHNTNGLSLVWNIKLLKITRQSV